MRALRTAALLLLVLGSLGFQAPAERAAAQNSQGPRLTDDATPIALPSPVPTLAPLQIRPGRGSRAAPLRAAPPFPAPGGLPAPPAPTPQAIATPTGRRESDDRGPRYAGWAMEAYPTLSGSTMEQIVARQRIRRGRTSSGSGTTTPAR